MTVIILAFQIFLDIVRAHLYMLKKCFVFCKARNQSSVNLICTTFVPQALEDAEEEARARTPVHPPIQMASSPASNLEIRLRSSTGYSSPPYPPTVRIQIPSPQSSIDEDVMGAGQNDESNKTSVVTLDPFPDVIKSAESSPRHSLAPVGDYFAGFNHPDGRRTREIINQINEERIQAVRRGQSAYALYGIQDNDEETWC